MRALAPLAPAARLVPASASAAPLVTTDPPLQPRFKKSITDYAIHCPDRSLTVTAEGRERTSAIEPGQAAEFTVGYEDSPTTRHSISGRIALLATLMCAATLAVPGPAGALAPRHWSPDVAAARRYLEHRAGNVSFAVRTERRLWGHRRLRVVPAASVLKAMLMVAYLNRREVRDRPLRDRDLRLLRPMIRRSDNVSANYIHNLVGNRGLRRLARRVGMRRFTPVAHPWGHSLVNAADQTRFFLRIDRFVPKRHRRRALRLLHSIVPSQRWGVAQVAPPEWELYFKGGWGSGTGAVDHQVALLRRGRLRVSVAVMTTANGSHAYGKATLRGVFRRLLRGLSGVQ